jgi:hypothetical protein
VLLLRKLGFEARYAVGYAVQEKAGDRKFVGRQRDAHAWCLVWNKDKGVWQDFDATPATWVEAEAAHASAFQRLSDLWENTWFQISKFRWGQTNLRKYILIATTPILAILLIQILFKRRARSKAGSGQRMALREPWPGWDSDFYALEQKLSREGVVRGPSEPLSQWLDRALRNPQLASLKNDLRRLLDLHYRYRFDPRGLTAEERATLSKGSVLTIDSNCQ